MDIKKKVIDILTEITGNLEITPKSRLSEILEDSLDEMDLTFELDDCFDFDYEAHDKYDTVQELIDLIEQESD